ncbi:piggyBac transposable element-derived protein 4-like [Acipenser ruthenus]|uniref:piggyBac transposable element-derived protein 4-like n=1 Tax=Acipenser ruthenus TaxID=7906 RepID=UPI0027414AA7|nr:piggyBac transposable element-derived protein 4-like [Acipenser ruthenus]
MEAAHISPELPIRWVVSADRTVEIKEEVTELGCDQANEQSLQEETPPSSITERGTLTETRLKLKMAQRRRMTTQERIDMLTALSENDSDAGNVSDYDSDESWICDTVSSTSESEESATEVPRSHRGLPRGRRGRGRSSSLGESSAVPAALPVSYPAAAAGVPALPTASPAAVPRTATPAASPARTGIQETGKDGTVWEIISPGVDAVGRRAAQNVLTETSGPTPYAKRNINSILSAFHLLIDMRMLHHIQRCTVAEAHRIQNDDSWAMSLEELEAFIAILYVRGAYGGKSLYLESLWSTQWGIAFFIETMSRNRFREILRFLSFDFRGTRRARLQTDKFALASEIWNGFIENSIACYKPGENLTVDEQLFSTKARCRWTQYMPNKPDKFGIKFWLAVDVDSKYVVNGYPYLGKDDTCPAGQRLGDNVVLRLMEPYLGKGRNVTTNNFFTSLQLAKKLKKKKTSLVGTVNKAGRSLPPSAQNLQPQLYSSTILKHNDCATLTVYKCKPRKNVIILSSRHTSVAIGTVDKKKPETVDFYNDTKHGVDVIDQMVRQYSVKAGSRRWPVAVFYNVLDLAAINSFVLYKECTGENISRRDFILKLATELRQKHFDQKTAKQPGNAAQSGFSAAPSDTRKRKQCKVAKCNKNKTSDICAQCERAVCGKCTGKVEKRYICVDCAT